MENRNGLIVDFRVDQANGFAERRTALAMLSDNMVKERRITVGGDKVDFIMAHLRLTKAWLPKMVVEPRGRDFTAHDPWRTRAVVR